MIVIHSRIRRAIVALLHFWATEIDLGGLKADRDQLMAEAYQLYKSATQWWPVGGEEELFRAEQEDRFNEDAWTDPC
jgi:putative DNA primase/helicase